MLPRRAQPMTSRASGISLDRVWPSIVWTAFAVVVGYTAVNVYAVFATIRRLPPTDVTSRVGDTIRPLVGVDHTAAEYTVVLVLRSDCPYCARNMGLYRSLAARGQGSQLNFQVVALCAEDLVPCGEYLKRNRVAVSAIAHYQPSADDVPLFRGTPTVLVLDGQRRIVALWPGAKDEAGQREIQSFVYELT